MVEIKVKRDSSGGNAYMKNALHYVHDKNGERPLSLHGNGVDPTSADAAYEQMYAVKHYFGKTSGNPIVHLIVSYDKTVQDAETACRYTEQIAAYYADQFQTLQCTHEKLHGKSRYHTHIIANSVSFVNGMMFRSGVPEMQGFCHHVEQVTGCKTRLDFEKMKEK